MDKATATNHLNWLLNPGDKVYLILRHVSASGMTRWISPIIFRKGRALDLTFSVCFALDLKRSNIHEGARIEGVGMDMGFHMIYELGRVLFPEGFAVEGRGRNGDTSGWDNDGGYALHKEWL